MYKVMIVDDEMLARIGMKSLIAWNNNGFELVGEYENGKLALEAARTIKPDIIITDIKMPQLSGIELIRNLKQEGFNIKYIILSSYDDFIYVKEAMKLGAEDYILKLEMEPDILLNLLKKTAEKIELECNKNSSYRKIDLNILKDNFIKDLLIGNVVETGEIVENLKQLNLCLPEKQLFVLYIKIINTSSYLHYNEQDLSIMNYSIINILDEIIMNYGTGYACEIRGWEYSIILSFRLALENHEKEPDILKEKLIKNIEELLADLLNLKVRIGVSTIFNEYNKMNIGFKEALNSYSKHEYIGNYNLKSENRMIIINAKEYIKKNIDKDISLEKLAFFLGLSPNYFSSIFSKETGESYIQYLINQRIELAKILLEENSYKIYDIAKRVGYPNAHYFSRIFKKITGVTPQEYKENLF